MSAAKPLVRADSAFYGRGLVLAAVRANVSVTIRLDAKVRATIAAIGEDAWETIEYSDAVFDESTGRWISRAEVAEIDFTAFSAQKKADHVPGRLVVRRIPDLNATPGQGTLFDAWRSTLVRRLALHAFCTTTDPATLDTVAADKTHRQHAIIEQVHADLKNSALLPSGKFAANGLAGPRGDRVQPHPRRRGHHRVGPGQGNHRHHPPQADRGSRPDRLLRATDQPAPPSHVALEAAWTRLLTHACGPPTTLTT